MILGMIQNRSQDSRAWRIVKRIKEVRRMYYNLIKRSTAMNQEIEQRNIIEMRKKRGRGLSSMNAIEMGSKATSPINNEEIPPSSDEEQEDGATTT